MMINKRLIKMVPEAKKYIGFKVLVNWLSLLLGIILWFCLGSVLNLIYLNTFSNQYYLFLIISVCIIGRYFLISLSSRLTHQATTMVKLRMRNSIFEKLIKLKGNYHRIMSTSELIQLAGEGVEQLEVYFGNYLPQFVFAMIAPLTLFLVYLPFSFMSALVLFVCVPLIPLAIIVVQKIAKKLLSKYWQAYTSLGDNFLENIQGLTTLKVYDVDQQYHQAMNKDAEDFRKITMKVLTMQLNSITIMDLVAYGGTALGSIFIGLAYLNNDISMGVAITLLLLASEFFLAMRALGSFFHVAMNGMAASDRMFKLLDLEEESIAELKVKNADIIIKDLSFNYGNNPVLQQIDLGIKQGSFLAIVGSSGSGKSTLASVLAQDLLNYQGSITVGNINIKDFSNDSLKELITMVSSNSYIFKGSIRDNLMIKSNLVDKDLIKVLQQVKLWDFLEQEKGLDFILSENASNISGGQKQRLALARALLKNSPIYIFDEATSNIDVESEEQINQVIHSLKAKHTLIVISHRLANVIKADQIVFLNQGSISEIGNHQELLFNNGNYAQMFKHQLKLENLRGGLDNA
ncbi:MAG: ABC transporter ATP-binding protein/permease [Erysipelotrichaceae bacterium]